MKQEIKINELRGRQAYVPASVKVIEITSRRVICQSERRNALNGTEMNEGNDNW